MIRSSVAIPPRIMAGLRRQAVSAAATECCGALIGTFRGSAIEVRTIVPVENDAAEPTRYRIDADTVLRLERRSACAGLHVVGFYHSHPVTDAEPSAIDLEFACPGYLYLIVQTDTGIVRGWQLRDDRSGFHEMDVTPLAGAA